MYSIKTVCAETGLLPVTLRAWEARYRLVSPSRSKGNYRQYTEGDLVLLRWVKRRVDSGTPIRLAAEEARHLRRAGMKWEEARAARPLRGGVPAHSAEVLYRALTAHDSRAAEGCLEDALARFDQPRVCLEVIAPCLWRIGESWERGEIRIATEHFASTLLRGRLLEWFQSAPAPRSGPLVLVGCAPQEFHDIGALMLALFLRGKGVRPEFLGQDLNLADLAAYAREVRPAMICLSANAEGTARRLIGFERSISGIRPHPRFGYGGRAFDQNPRLQTEVPGIFLSDLPGAVEKIRKLLTLKSQPRSGNH